MLEKIFNAYLLLMAIVLMTFLMIAGIGAGLRMVLDVWGKVL